MPFDLYFECLFRMGINIMPAAMPFKVLSIFNRFPPELWPFHNANILQICYIKRCVQEKYYSGSISSPSGTGSGIKREIAEVTGTGGFGVYGTGPGTDYGTSSSIRWKKNICVIPDPLSRIIAIRGVFFDWDKNHGGKHDVGMIAEEVGKVLPEIVDYEQNGIDAIGLDYSKITPLLVEAIKAQQAEILILKGENNRLKADLNHVKTMYESRLSKLESLVGATTNK